METFMNGAMVIEATLLSFLLALWITWMGLRGLFRLIPATIRVVQPIRFVAAPRQANRRLDAA